MSLYLFQASFTSQALGLMVQNPQDRAAVFSSFLEKLNGRLHDFYYSFGEYDVAVIFEVPDDSAALTAVSSIAAAGHLVNLKTTKLFSNTEAMEALGKAGSMRIQPPS